MLGKISTILDNLKDFNLRIDEEIIEECDYVNELLFEIEIIIYNNLFNNLLENVNDNLAICAVVNSKEYLDEVSMYYLLDKNNEKIFLTEFLHLIYLDQNKDEWHMYGDEKYKDEYE